MFYDHDLSINWEECDPLTPALFSLHLSRHSLQPHEHNITDVQSVLLTTFWITIIVIGISLAVCLQRIISESESQEVGSYVTDNFLLT